MPSASVFGIRSLDTTIIVDAEGKIVYKDGVPTGEGKLREELVKLIDIQGGAVTQELPGSRGDGGSPESPERFSIVPSGPPPGKVQLLVTKVGWRKGILDLLARYQAKGEIGAAIDVVEAANAWVHLMFGVFMDCLLARGRSGRRSGFLTPEFRRRVQSTALGFAARLQGRS